MDNKLASLKYQLDLCIEALSEINASNIASNIRERARRALTEVEKEQLAEAAFANGQCYCQCLCCIKNHKQVEDYTAWQNHLQNRLETVTKERDDAHAKLRAISSAIRVLQGIN